MPAKVVIIDDERFQMGHYKRALSAADFQPVLIPNTSSLAPIIKGNEHQDVSFFMVDMMMPPDELYGKEATSYGLFTGLFVLRDLRKKFPVIPIILWTSAHIDTILMEAERQATRTTNCYYSRKVDLSPSMLVSELSYYVKKGRFRPRIRKFLWKAVRVGSHILGAGADIKGISS